MKELSKEQEDQIEFEANRYANDFSETSSQHPFLKRGYIAAASKYLLRVKDLEEEIERLTILLERVVTREYSECKQTEKNKLDVWNNFKRQNNIK